MRGFKFLRSPLAIVLVALFLRLLLILIRHTYVINDDYWSGFEMANLARSLVQGHGFASPWGGATGPSAWTAPIYPWLIALTFRIFGVFSHGAALALLTLNSIFSALTCWTLYRIGRRVFGETVAVCTGWLWALHPASIYFSVLWIWETSLSAFLLSLVFLVTLEMAEDDRLLARLRSTVGSRWPNQSGHARVASLLRLLAGLPATPSRQTVSRACIAWRLQFLDRLDALGGPKLHGVSPTDLNPIGFWRGTSWRKQLILCRLVGPKLPPRQQQDFAGPVQEHGRSAVREPARSNGEAMDC
jgi:hypothetical protein